MNRKIILQTTAMLLLVSLTISGYTVIFCDESSSADSESEFTITDTTGATFTYDGPSEHIIVFGFACTLTVLDCGGGNKIVACDKYGYQNIDNVAEYSDLNVEVIPWLSSSNIDSIYTWLIQAVEDGKISLTDTIILSTYSITVADGGLRDRLEDAGFTHVIFYGTMTEYSDLVQCVEDIANIVGDGYDLSVHMQYIADEISSTIESSVTTKTDGIFLWYSTANGWGAGNTGSLAVAMMEIVGANNIAYNSDSTSTIIYDESRILQLLEENPDTVIFMDGAYIRDYGGSVETFITDFLGGNTSFTILVMDKTWNNYDPESADGLWSMASALYPDLFSGTTPTYTVSNESSNTWVYAVAGAIVIILIIGIIAYLYKSKH